MQEHFDIHVCKEKSSDRPTRVQNAMAYGTENEINATATFVHVVVPVLTPTDVLLYSEIIVGFEVCSHITCWKYTEQVE
jgi:hypothetical protein